jgi:hypothetical protein
MPHVNYWAVLVSGVAIFILGGLWYSPMLFAKPWTRMMGKTEEEMKAYMASPKAKREMPLMYGMALVTALITAWVMAIVVNHFGHHRPFAAQKWVPSAGWDSRPRRATPPPCSRCSRRRCG